MTIHLLLAAVFAAAPSLAEPTLRERARSTDQADIPALREAMTAADAADRAEAAFGLGQFGLRDVPEGDTEPASGVLARAAAQELLVPAVSDPDAAVRRAAVEALGKVGGRDAESFVLAAATDYDAGVRGQAALALFRQRLLKRTLSYSAEAVSRLVLLAGDAEADVRWRAAYAFSRWEEPRAAAALAALQSDADARARLFAVRALGRLKTAPDAARLTDADPYVRAEAVAAFSAAKAWDKLPDAVFTDASAHVRAAAADAAAASGDAKRFAPLLETLAVEPGTLASGRAVLALAKLRGAAAAPAVERAAADPRWWLRARAAEAAAWLPDAEARLLKAAADADPRVASQALETMAASTTPAVIALYDRTLRDPKAALETRGAVVDAAGDLTDPGLLEGLIVAKTYATGPGSSEMREGLIKAFKAVAAKHPETSARAAAALKGFKEFEDKPRRLRALKTAPSVVFVTERGSFTIALSNDAAGHAAAFVDSVKKKLYDGTVWHRVVTAFVVQGGDPRGSGWGDAGWRLADEVTRIPFDRGTVGMPKAGKDTGGCQLFISLVPTPHLDGRYTAFGRVSAGMDVVDRLEPGDRIVSARLE